MNIIRENLEDLVDGGFAPVLALLREFPYSKMSHKLDGMPFSAWQVFQHMYERQYILIKFMLDPETYPDIWPEPWWPKEAGPRNTDELNLALWEFELQLEQIHRIINQDQDLFEIQKNGKTKFWAVVAIIQHNAYHIGQIKTIGRQLGVW